MGAESSRHQGKEVTEVTLDHIALITGLGAVTLIVFTVLGVRNLRKSLSEDKRAGLEQFLSVLDTVKFLPLLWILAVGGVGYWLISRVVISYLPQ